ncbi:Alg9-like mannosyltransferase family-domain-containing protein [Cantharellus anzutake]|uniref:Alg9-like mannosyltransferase family-domain-containing protein n=1 Tax=Cantharellus anzutake TaxID=1750568 RepID=UPI0019036DC7|nr:Alg9-like mannosyltransferase family-domain-containing protein [Cantharellus anzutake]KAF8339810.1 Alg9-like mannosyltransferase family-domain-containing protein [Cantharellus anzutake]
MIIDILLYAVTALHVLLAPYTKVEESFNLHALHDVLMYGVSLENLSKYDHFVFPGVVPRTFIGSLILATLVKPVLFFANELGLLRSKSSIQVVARVVLGLVNAYGLTLVQRAVSRQFGRKVGSAFLITSLTQFHLLFWMSRTLPNTFALFPVNIASSLLIRSSPSKPHVSLLALALLMAAAVIFRAELVLFLAPWALQLLLTRRNSLISLVATGISAGLAALFVTTRMDAYFWKQETLWPELAGVLFNVYEGKSADWGISPAHAYFFSLLPKLLMGGAPLSMIGFLVDSRIRFILLPSLAFVTLISGLAHKEWRFIVYVVPIFNVAAARGISWLLARKGLLRPFLTLVVAGLLFGNLSATVLLSVLSQNNYPGGEALHRLHNLADETHARVYIDDYAAQSGASLFLQERGPPQLSFRTNAIPRMDWQYIKLKFNNTDTFSHALVEDVRELGGKWEVLDVVQVQDGLSFGSGDNELWDRIPRLRMKNALWIVTRR